MTIGNDMRTIFGDTPKTIAERLDLAGADVIGLNCSVGPDVMLDAMISSFEGNENDLVGVIRKLIA